MRADGSRGRLARSGAGSLTIQVASLGLGFLLAIVLARGMSVEGYGVYSYVFALISVLTVPAKFGLPVLIVREVARSRVDGAWGRLRGIIRWSNAMAGTFALILALSAGVIALVAAGRFPPMQIATFAWALVLVLPMVLGEMRGAALRGLGRVVQGQLPERVLRPAFTIVFCAAFIALHPEALRPDVAMSLHALAAVVAFAIGAWLFLRVRPPEVRAARPVYEHRAWLASAWPLALAAGMQVLSSHTDILMLGVFASSSEVGVYRAASQCAGLVGMSLIAINQVVAPRFAGLHARGDLERLQRVATMGSRLILLGAAPVAAVMIFFGDVVLSLVFGHEYASGHLPLALLAAGQLCNAAFGSVATLLNMSGHEAKTARGVLIAQLANLALSLALIPPFGAVGAASATALTVALWNAILWYEVRRHLGINSAAIAL